MILDDGAEALVQLCTPLPARLAVDLMNAVADVARYHGYTDVVILTDGTSRIVATPQREGSTSRSPSTQSRRHRAQS